MLLLVSAASAQDSNLDRARRAWLGISVREASANETGVEVTVVEPQGPAAGAGIRAGDVIVAVDGAPVADRAAFVSRVQDRHPGERLRLTLRRAGAANQTVDIALAARRDGFDPDALVDRLQGSWSPNDWFQVRPEFGADLVDLDADLAAYFHAPRPDCALVTRVLPGGAGDRGGLEAGDLVLGVDGRDVHSTGELRQQLANRAAADSGLVDVVVWRHERRTSLRLEVESRGSLFRPSGRATPRPSDDVDGLRRELQQMHRELDALRREVDLLRRQR